MTTDIATDKRIFHPLIEDFPNWLKKIFSAFNQKKLKEEYQEQERQKKVNAFIDQVLLPDMVERGFGFGRAAVAEYLRRHGVDSFVALDNLSVEVIDGVAEAKGVGPKVFKGFLAYVARRSSARNTILALPPAFAGAQIIVTEGNKNIDLEDRLLRGAQAIVVDDGGPIDPEDLPPRYRTTEKSDD